ncbi:hypothetical protein U1Q18_049104, partial [Sarracenia purpurea var. burkii]
IAEKSGFKGGVATDLKVDDHDCSILGPNLGEGSLSLKEVSVKKVPKLEVTEESGVKG